MQTSTILRASLLAAALGAALSASAVTLVLDTPNITLARPTSGTLTYVFNGTVVADPGTIISATTVAFPGNSAGTVFLSSTLYNDVSGTSTYTGRLFSVTIDAATPFDVYKYNSTTGSGRSLYEVFDSEGFAANYTSVTVAPVPEPSALAALGIGALGFLKPRKRA